MNTPSVEPNQQRPSRRAVFQRLFGRLRHGLLTQEILDRLARAGFIFYPYFVASEPAPNEAAPLLDERCTLRALSAADAADIARVAMRRTTEQAIVRLQSQATCLGIFYDGELAGYTWARLDLIPIPFTRGQPMVALQPSEAYLFDMYVASQYRGLRLAGFLRQSMQRELLRKGRTRFYSITLAFNRSSRRFKARLGVREIELRLYIRLRLGSLPGLDLRLWRRQPHIASRRAKRVHGAIEPQPRG
jgi:ribosomal protein S18 acetylase RimI-like enzyme